MTTKEQERVEEFGFLLDKAIEAIREHISDNFDIDDVAYGDGALKVPVFDARDYRNYKLVAEFRFYRDDSEPLFDDEEQETHEDMMKRFEREIREFCEVWL